MKGFMSGARRPAIRTPTSNFLAPAYYSALSSQLSRFFSICAHCEIAWQYIESFLSFDPLVKCQKPEGKPRPGCDHPARTSSPPLRQGRLPVITDGQP